jgi:hypothetical protein
VEECGKRQISASYDRFCGAFSTKTDLNFGWFSSEIDKETEKGKQEVAEQGNFENSQLILLLIFFIF